MNEPHSGPANVWAWNAVASRRRRTLVTAAVAVVIGATAAAIFWWKPSGSPEPPESASVPQGTTGVRLAEIRFLPADGAPAFVEILNAGPEPITLNGATLRNDRGDSFAIPGGLTIDPGARLLVNFDGRTGAEGAVVHGPAGFALGESGSMLLEAGAIAVDAVAWGKPQLASVNLCRGGRCAPPEPGSVIARLPHDTRPFVPAAWALLDPAQATPSAPNPRPPVSAFAGMPGAIFTANPRFSWYSVPGATRYRLQVGTDEAFTSIVHQAEIEATAGVRLEQLSVRGPALSPGRYFWRVQAIGSDAAVADFSRPMPFSVDPSRTLRSSRGQARSHAPEAHPVATSGAQATGSTGEAGAQAEVLKVLDVPVFDHAKDTRMLTLEAKSEQPLWSWDTPDTAGYPYCARAGVAMVNAYYGGKLSQDRIGYEAFKDLREGPEYDLPVVGMPDYRTSRYSLPLALGTSGDYKTFESRAAQSREDRDTTACYEYIVREALQLCANACTDKRSQECVRCRLAREDEVRCPPEIDYRRGFEAIADIRQEIDAGRPIIATLPSHLFLIVGYRLQNGRFFLFYQDEGGRVEHEADARGLAQNLDSYWTGLVPITVASDEPEVTRDSDGDGVVDFDEAQRFGTDPAQRDSDGDGINDKDEISASVWDPQHGYHRTAAVLNPTDSDVEAAAANADLSGRDFDRDGLAMELDADSDGGGCRDGEEDADLDGRREPGEASNFDGEDDDCGPPPLGGRVTLSYDYSGGTGVCTGRVDIKTRFELQPVRDPDAPDVVTVYRAPAMTYDIRTEGCRDVPGDVLFYRFDEGFHVSGTAPVTDETLAFAAFWPTWPKLSMQLPIGVTFPGREPNRLVGTYTVDGAVYPAETFVRFEALTIESDPAYCTNPGDPNYARPWELEFCTEPTPCAGIANAPLECLSDPTRYYVLPFTKSFRWNGPANEPGLDQDIDNVSVDVEICPGCGRSYFD